MPTREQKRTAACVWRVHCPNPGQRFPARLVLAAEWDGQVTIQKMPTNKICDLTFERPCKWDKVARWAKHAMGQPEKELDIYPVDETAQRLYELASAKPAAPGPGPGVAPALATAASASTSASAPALALDPKPDPRAQKGLALEVFTTNHEPGNLYLGNVVSAHPGLC